MWKEFFLVILCLKVLRCGKIAKNECADVFKLVSGAPTSSMSSQKGTRPECRKVVLPEITNHLHS